MKYSHAIILTVFLIIIFCIFFGWFLYRSCHRAIDAEFQELQYRRDVVAVATAAPPVLVAEGPRNQIRKDKGKGNNGAKK